MLRAFFNWIGVFFRRATKAPRLGAAVSFSVALAIFSAPGSSQQLPAISPDQLQQLQQQYIGQSRDNSSNIETSTDSLRPLILQPAVPDNGSTSESRLEQILSSRAGVRLQQFGYDQLGKGSAVQVPQTGAVQDEYVLGPGDEIIVSLRGQENNEYRATVDRNGQIIIPRLSPIPASGRTFGSFRQDLQAAVSRAYVTTNVFVSVGRMRQIGVLVSGEVNNPGLRQLTGLNSAVDALLLSGGVKKTGSLRNIRIQREGHEYTVDLYNVLTAQGRAASLGLADGDRILVPPLGPTVAVAGLVRRPGIFELAPRTTSISANELLALAGGQELRGNYRLSLLQILPDGRTELVRLSTLRAAVRDSEILFAQLGADQTRSQATLSGGTSLAGAYPITSGTKLSDVIKAPGALGPSPYTPFGIIVRTDPVTLTRSLEAFAPVAVLRGTEDLSLQNDDVIRTLSVNESQLLTYVVHSYLAKLQEDQSAIRNPLAQATANANNTVSSTLATQTDEVSTELSDISGVPSDIQRREIIALLDTPAPGTPLARLREQQEDARAQAVQLGAQQQSGNVNGLQQQPQQLRQSQQQLPPVGSDFQPGINQYSQQNQLLGQRDSNLAQRNPDQTYDASGNPDQPRNFMDEPVGSGQFASNREVSTFGELSEQLGIDPLVLVNFLVDHRARLDGAVHGPGFYFVGPGISLSDLVQAAGGTVNWADESGVELISTAVDQQTGRAETRRLSLPLQTGTLANYIVRPRDQLRFGEVFSDAGIGSVTIQGEVRYAGSYPILRGEHLSDLLSRAGGLSETAYPYGTVFLRKSAAQVEREGYERAASEIEDELVVAMTRVGSDKIDPNTFASMQTFVSELRNQRALGRISVVADPSVLAANAAVDPLLEAGDVIFVPQRPSTVSVLGQVMQPGSYSYKAGMSVEDYIERAGGYSHTAESGSTFVVMPDGSARKIEKSWLHFDAADVLPPGSAIVVPRDVTPLDLRQTIIDVSQIFSQFAVAIASVAVLSKQ